MPTIPIDSFEFKTDISKIDQASTRIIAKAIPSLETAQIQRLMELYKLPQPPIESPCTLLAAAGNSTAVQFMLDKGLATPTEAALGYARALDIENINQLISKNPTTPNVRLYAIIGCIMSHDITNANKLCLSISVTNDKAIAVYDGILYEEALAEIQRIATPHFRTKLNNLLHYKPGLAWQVDVIISAITLSALTLILIPNVPPITNAILIPEFLAPVINLMSAADLSPTFSLSLLIATAIAASAILIISAGSLIAYLKKPPLSPRTPPRKGAEPTHYPSLHVISEEDYQDNVREEADPEKILEIIAKATKATPNIKITFFKQCLASAYARRGETEKMMDIAKQCTFDTEQEKENFFTYMYDLLPEGIPIPRETPSGEEENQNTFNNR